MLVVSFDISQFDVSCVSVFPVLLHIPWAYRRRSQKSQWQLAACIALQNAGKWSTLPPFHSFWHEREVSQSGSVLVFDHLPVLRAGHRAHVVQHRWSLGIWVTPGRVTWRSEEWCVDSDTSAKTAILGCFPLSCYCLAAIYSTKPSSDFPCLEEEGSVPIAVSAPPCNPIALPENTFSVVQCIIFIWVCIFNSWHAKYAICLCNNAFLFNRVLPLLFFCQPLAVFHFSSKWKNSLLK